MAARSSRNGDALFERQACTVCLRRNLRAVRCHSRVACALHGVLPTPLPANIAVAVYPCLILRSNLAEVSTVAPRKPSAIAICCSSSMFRERSWFDAHMLVSTQVAHRTIAQERTTTYLHGTHSTRYSSTAPVERASWEPVCRARPRFATRLPSWGRGETVRGSNETVAARRIQSWSPSQRNVHGTVAYHRGDNGDACGDTSPYGVFPDQTTRGLSPAIARYGTLVRGVSSSNTYGDASITVHYKLTPTGGGCGWRNGKARSELYLKQSLCN